MQPVQALKIQFRLAAKVPAERALAQSGGTGDVADGDAIVAVAAEPDEGLVLEAVSV